MASENKELNAGLDSSPPSTPDRLHLNAFPKQSIDQTLSQVPTPYEEYDPNNASPFSPFYSHPTTRTSFEQLKCASSTNLKVYETDLESGSSAKRFSMEPSHDNKPCRVWPKKSQLIKEKKNYKSKRGCAPWNTMTKKQKLITKIVVLLLVLGLVVGVAVGISKAVGGSVYKDEDHTSQIGS